MVRRLSSVILFIVVVISDFGFKNAYCGELCLSLPNYPIIFIGKVIDVQLKDETFEEFDKRKSELTNRRFLEATVILKAEVIDLLEGELNKIVDIEAMHEGSDDVDAIRFSKGKEYIFFGYLNDAGKVLVNGRCQGPQEVASFGLLSELKKKLQSMKESPAPK